MVRFPGSAATESTPTVLELVCGIGGRAAALGLEGQVVAAVDLSQLACQVYRQIARVQIS